MRILETERLRLRTVEMGDAAFYLCLLNTPSFIDNIGDRGIRTLEAAREALAVGPLAMQATLGHSIYLVERKDDATPVGMCGLIKREMLDDVDIGYAFLPAHCGMGYAYEAAAAVLLHARHDVGLKRVVAIVSPENAASNRLLRKLGLRLDKVVHLTADDPGTYLYVLDLTAPR